MIRRPYMATVAEASKSDESGSDEDPYSRKASTSGVSFSPTTSANYPSSSPSSSQQDTTIQSSAPSASLDDPSSETEATSTSLLDDLAEFRDTIANHKRETPNSSMRYINSTACLNSKSARITRRLLTTRPGSHTGYTRTNMGWRPSGLITILSDPNSSIEELSTFTGRYKRKKRAAELASQLAMRPPVDFGDTVQDSLSNAKSSNYWPTKKSIYTAATLTSATLIGLNLDNVTSALSDSYSCISTASKSLYSSYAPSCISNAATSIYSYAPSLASVGNVINSYAPSRSDVLSELGWIAGVSAVVGAGIWYSRASSAASKTEANSGKNSQKDT